MQFSLECLKQPEREQEYYMKREAPAGWSNIINRKEIYVEPFVKLKAWAPQQKSLARFQPQSTQKVHMQVHDHDPPSSTTVKMNKVSLI